MFVKKLKWGVVACYGVAAWAGCNDAVDTAIGGMCMAVQTPIDNTSATMCEAPPNIVENFGTEGQCSSRPATDYDHTLAVDDPKRTAPLPGGEAIWPACDVVDGREDWVLVGTKAPGAGARTKAFDEIRKLLEVHDHVLSMQEIEEAAIKSGMRTMLQDAMLHVVAGRTTLEEIFRVVG